MTTSVVYPSPAGSATEPWRIAAMRAQTAWAQRRSGTPRRRKTSSPTDSCSCCGLARPRMMWVHRDRHPDHASSPARRGGSHILRLDALQIAAPDTTYPKGAVQVKKKDQLSPQARRAFARALATPMSPPTPHDPAVARRRALANGARATRRYSKEAQERNSFLIGDRDTITHARNFTDNPLEWQMRGNRKVVA